MATSLLEKYLNQRTIGIVLLLILASILLLSVTGILPLVTGVVPLAPCPVAACNPGSVPDQQNILVFTAPSDKIAGLKDPAFTGKLFAEALAAEPLLATPGTQVHMGFWSGKGNHGSMLRVLDTINEGPGAAAVPPNRAIWDEGTTAYYNYPSYTQLLDEHWYERASVMNGTVRIFGRAYTDPYPVTFAELDMIWGLYSSRYTDMAEPIAIATGHPVKVWCFIQGAKTNRIFYTYELPQLRLLEQKGYAQVYFVKSPDADWTKPEDWINGTANVQVASG
ncbi:MAG: hypothetical protein WC620_11005 [Methanoregula sp.]|jgi:hypothetical protein